MSEGGKGKGISPGDFLGGGLRRSSSGQVVDTSTSTRVPVPPEAQAPSPPRERYERATFYLRPEQVRWARKTAREVADDGAVSASDIARVGLDLAAQLPVEELRQLIVERATAESQRFPGRHNRGMPD